MNLILGFLSNLSARMYLYGGLALGVVLVLFGAYRKGVKAERWATERRSVKQIQRNRKTKEAVAHEIHTRNRSDGITAQRRLLEEWSRDDGA